MVRLVVLALIAAAVVWAATEGRRRWLVYQLRSTAERHGYVAAPERRPLPRRFDIPGAAGGSTADLAMTDPASGAIAFRHRYRSGRDSGADPVKEHLHVLVPLPFNAPHVLLRRPTLTNRLGGRLGVGDTGLADHHLTRALGLVDVEVGNEVFDRAWQVSTDDERFVRRLTAGRSAVELARRTEFEGQPLRYEFFGPWVLVSGPGYTIDDAALLLGWQRNLAGLLPADLATDYPAPPDPVDPWG